ncbi:MAG: redoxin domain-containing protein [Chloroflexi bacterium]|nr:redoxin domain-containing protein [Chloroflexota bacterium]
MRQLAAYEAKKGELESLGASVVAAVVDGLEATRAVAESHGITFPIAYGVTGEQIAGLDPWWADDHHGYYPQPMEFLILRGGTLFGTLYASGPVGRMHVDEVLTSIRGREKTRLVK